jgi:protease IV
MENDMTPPNPTAAPPVAPPVLPPLRSAAPAPKPRRSLGWMIAAIVLFCLRGLSLLPYLFGFLGGFGGVSGAMHKTAGPRLEEVVVEAATNSTANKILVINVTGIIMGESLGGGSASLPDMIQAQLKRAARDKEVKAVVLKVDSPGGEVLASDEIYGAILKFQTNSQKPVVASMGSVAASGGYYVSAPCEWIVANEMTITGSIGVIMSSYNYRGLMDKVGLKPVVFKSGKYKDMLRGSKEENEVTPEERKLVQNLIDETYQRFRTVVKEGRAFAQKQNQGRSQPSKGLASDWPDYADGRILSGREALRLGFVDELGGLSTAVTAACRLANIKEASVVEYQEIFDLSNLFRVFGQSDSKAVKINVGLDLPKLKAGYLYFLSPNFVQ